MGSNPFFYLKARIRLEFDIYQIICFIDILKIMTFEGGTMRKILFVSFIFIFVFFVSSCVNPGNTAGRKELLEVKDALTFNTLEVEEDFILPLISDYGVRISWTSDNSAIEISDNRAIVTRGEIDVSVTLIATLTLNNLTEQKEFIFAVKGLPSAAPVTVQFFVRLPENTPMDEPVVIAGSFGDGKPLWDPANSWGVATRVSPTEASFEIIYEDLTESLVIEYKWTRGDWGTVEKLRDNEELDNRTVTVDPSNPEIIVNDVVEKWADLELPVEKTDEERVDEAKAALILSVSAVMEDFVLPITGLNETTISWTSHNEEIIVIENENAKVTRPAQTTIVQLTATIQYNTVTDTKDFEVTVVGTEPSQDDLDVLAAASALSLGSLNNLTSDINLPSTGINDTAITWTSSHPESIEIVVGESGTIGKVTRLDSQVTGITLTATITKNLAKTTKTFTASVRASAFTVEVTWIITIPEALPNAVVITTGSSNNGWNPANLSYGIATKINDTTYEFKKTFSSANGNNISLQYKWTLQVPGAGFAPWSGEELTLDGVPINNRTLTITRNTSIVEDTVLRWRILVGGTPESTVVGNLDIVSLTDPRLPSTYQTRNVRIWTPTDYDPTDTTKKYPVIYMHDGQNVFDSVTSFAGEWGVDETITSLMEIGGFGGAIVVGIDNTADRMAEYTYPYSWLSGTKRGDLYMDFIIDVVMPYVNEHYQTKTGREDTILAGSSMGGLISFFSGLARLDTFGVIVPFSTSTQQVSNGATNIPALLETLNPTLLQTTKFYLYVGNNSDGNAGWPAAYKGYLLDAGVPEENVATYVGDGFTHNEYAWRTHFPLALEWAFGLVVDKTKLETLFYSLDYKEEDYFENSWIVLQNAKSYAEAVLANNDALLTEVVEAYSRLTSAISQLVLLSDMDAANAVDQLIVPLPTVADFDIEEKEALDLAKAAYDALTPSQKKLVKFYYVLDLLSDKLESLEGANQVNAMIAALPSLEELDVETDKQAVLEAIEAYNQLSSIGKSLVTDYEKLQALDYKIKGMELKARIQALPELDSLALSDKPALDEAIALYNTIPSTIRNQYLESSEVSKITALSHKIHALNVDQMIIDLLPVEELTLDDQEALLAVRAAYNALNSIRKGYVTQLDNLIALEEKMAELLAGN